MKKIIVFLCVLLLVSCGPKTVDTDAPFDGVDIETVSNDFNELLKMGDFEGMKSFDYTDDLQAYLDKNSMEAIFDQLGVGPVIKQYETVKSLTDGYTIFTTPTEFENASYNVNLVFDVQGKIGGINVAEFTGTNQAADIDLEGLALSHHQAFADGDVEKLEKEFSYTGQMKEAIKQGLFSSQATSEAYGQLKAVKESFSFTTSGYTIVSTPVVYEKKSFNYDLAFDDKGNIAGLSFSDFAEKTEELDDTHVQEVPLDAEVNGMTLPGILTLPTSGEDFPVVILVHGSGASDKDETIMGNKPFKDIAWGLAERGIASYRYDKSTYAAPERFASMTEMTLMDETVNDAVEIFDVISKREEINSDAIFVLGHSLGGHAIPLIAEKTNAKGYIIAAGNVRALHEMMLEQVTYILNIDDVITEDEKAYIDTFETDVEKVRNLDEMKEDEAVLGAYKAYWAFLEAYKPLEVAMAIDARVLVLQGERDYQVTIEDYKLWLNQFSSDDKWTFNLYPTLNHLLMPGEGKATNEEYKKQNHVSENLIEDIANWIKGGL
ncbi:DUF3887 domain-containing protein [Acidaminobacter sp. JC074]|uniref:alpha/beta hydrolase n=1 Tax=Acidaminobacter sp. JC074 TaxID=2530199 RepID=UPI001F0D7949|nr:DUF3887 domain-containing protein [Acidaminobacter sp. JC074]MCH4886679.1 DUF3887 domain-containing protein [Acidaminobacter sp. JC074]